MATNVQPTVRFFFRFSLLYDSANTDGSAQGNKGMQISSHPNPKNLPLDQSGKRGWSFPLCGCFDECGTCMFAQTVLSI